MSRQSGRGRSGVGTGGCQHRWMPGLLRSARSGQTCVSIEVRQDRSASGHTAVMTSVPRKSDADTGRCQDIRMSGHTAAGAVGCGDGRMVVGRTSGHTNVGTANAREWSMPERSDTRTGVCQDGRMSGRSDVGTYGCRDIRLPGPMNVLAGVPGNPDADTEGCQDGLIPGLSDVRTVGCQDCRMSGHTDAGTCCSATGGGSIWPSPLCHHRAWPGDPRLRNAVHYRPWVAPAEHAPWAGRRSAPSERPRNENRHHNPSQAETAISRHRRTEDPVTSAHDGIGDRPPGAPTPTHSAVLWQRPERRTGARCRPATGWRPARMQSSGAAAKTSW